MNDIKFETKFSAEKKVFDLNIKEIFKYKDLIYLLVKRNLLISYKQTILGPLWIILSPFVTSIVFSFIFGQVAGISTDGIPQLLFYMTGNTIWGYFIKIFLENSKTFISNASVFGKVYFPRLIVPIANVINSLINLGVQSIMVIIIYFYYKMLGIPIFISKYIFLLPIILIQVGLLGLGCGIIVSAITTKYRDLAIAVDLGTQLWMYITPIVFPLSSTTGLMRKIILINPMTIPVEIFRKALLGTGEFNLEYWLLSLSITVIVSLIGILLFNRVEKTFIDTI